MVVQVTIFTVSCQGYWIEKLIAQPTGYSGKYVSFIGVLHYRAMVYEYYHVCISIIDAYI